MAAAVAAAPAPRSPWLSWALLLLLAALLPSAFPAAPEKEVPNRSLRVRDQSSPHRSSIRWRLPHSSGLRSPHRYPSYRSGYGESNRKMSYIPLPKEERNDEMKKLASESVHVVSLQSRTSQALSQPAYRSALKVAEEEEQEEAKDITVRVMSSQSVLVTWSDSISEKQRPTPSRQYSVRYREKGESARWDYKQVPNKRVLVDKLIPDTMYEFAVRISQGEKEGKWSASVYQRTPEAAPTSAPENLEVLPIKGKATSVTATWDALSESEGRVKEYILSYAPALKPFGAKSITYPGETTSAIVDDLEPGERYIFKIRAGNRRGQGPQSKAFSVVLPATSIPELKSSRQTHTEDALEIKLSGNTEQSPSIQTSSVLSETISKHTSGHSSSVPHGRNTESSLSDFKKKLLSGSGILPKMQLSSRRRIEPETDSHSIESTSDHDSSSRTSMQSKIHDVKSHVTPHSPVKSSHSVPSSGRTALRPRTLVRTGQISTDKQRLSLSSSSAHTSVSLSASSSPKDTGSETQNARHGNANHHSSSEVTVDNLPDDNESNDQIDNTEKTSVKSSKTPGDTHLILSSNQQPSVSQKVIHPTKLLTPSVSLKPSASSVSINSQKHSRYPSNKLVPSDTSGTPETYKSRETEQREQKPSSRVPSPRGGSSTAVQRKPLSHFSHHTLRDSRVATSAVSAAVTHTLPHSHGSSSAKNKHYGRDDSDDKSENSEKENEEHRQRSSSTSSSRLSSSQPVSERFNLFKYRSALTANRFANKTGNTQNARIQPSEAPSSTLSSKLQPQSSSQLTSGSVHKFNANTDKHRELEGEDEHPLSTPHHGHSSSFSRQSSSVDYSRRKSSLTELRNPHIIAPTEKSNPTNVKEESFGEERKHTDAKMYSLHKDSLSSVSGQSQSLSRINHRSSPSQRLTNGQSSRSKGSTSSTDSLSRTSIEKPTPLLPSMYQPDDLDTKDDISAKSVQTPLLSKKTLVGNSHALSRKTLHPEPSHYQRAVTDQSRHQPSLNSRSHLRMTSFQNKEKLEDEESENLGENYYEGAHDKEEQRAFPSIPIRDVSSSRRISTSLSQGNMDTFLLKHSDTHTRKSGERSPNQRESLTSSRGLSSSPGKPIGSQVISSSEVTSGASKLPVTSHQSKYVQPGSTSVGALAKDHQYSRGTSFPSKSSSTNLRQTHFITPHSQSGFKVPTRTASQIEKKHGLFQPTPTKVELYPKTTYSKIHQSLSNNNGNYEDYDQSETEENPTSSSVTRWSPSISRDSKRVKNNVVSDKSKSPNPTLPHKGRFSDEKEYKQKEEVEEEPSTSRISNSAPLGRSTSLTSRSSQSPNKSNTSPKLNLALPRSSGSASVPSQRHPTHSVSPTHSSSSQIVSTSQQKQHSRLLNPSQQQQARVPHRQGNGGRPNLTTKLDLNNKIIPGGNGKRNGQRIINGPQGIQWIVDLDRGLVLNVEGRYLQDSQGKPLRVKLGGDGRTVVDFNGAPIVSPDGLPLFGNGRFSKPVANAQDKPIISLGGKPLIGLEMIKKTTTPSTTRRTTITTTTTTTTSTTTTPEPTTTEPPTEKPLPTCPPGSYAEYDDEGNLIVDLNGLPECNSEDVFSGHEADIGVTTESYVVYEEDYEFFETTLPPSTTTTTEALPEIGFPEFSNVGSDPLSEYDAAGKKRFSAPYVIYLNKDLAAPCSLTEALDHFQVENLNEIIPAGLQDLNVRPQKAPHNITIVAVEGCHSFVIVDWAKPMHGDLVTGYLVYSASYDDFLRNKWSTKTAGSTHLPIENLKPNTRYYFKVQAKNLYGYGPISSSVSYITESDNPLLIVRPPGGEPIWIPFTFKYDPTYSECSGKQYVKRTWYRKFVGVVLCNSLRYKIYLSDDLRDTFYSVGDSWGRGEDHCQFVDSHLDGRTGPQSYVEALPTIQGYYRQYRQEPVSFGRIGYMTPYYYVGWYECGVPIPGKW